MSSEQLRLLLVEARPVIYIASALSFASGDMREEIAHHCSDIKKAAEGAARKSKPPWELAVHAPSVESSPWEAPEVAPEDIFDTNIRIVCEESDAVIVLGTVGGSLGAGQEFAWACALRLPVLYLRKKGDPISRQVRGTPIDLEIAEFASRKELAGAVSGYVGRRRHRIQTHARQRADRVIALQSLMHALREEWDRLNDQQRQAATAIAQLNPRRVAMLIERPGALRAASLDEVLALCGSLGVDAGRHLTAEALPELSHEQREALKTAAAEYEWDVAETLELMGEARLEIARGGIRRLRLSTPEDWKRFRESRRP